MVDDEVEDVELVQVVGVVEEVVQVVGVVEEVVQVVGVVEEVVQVVGVVEEVVQVVGVVGIVVGVVGIVVGAIVVVNNGTWEVKQPTPLDISPHGVPTPKLWLQNIPGAHVPIAATLKIPWTSHGMNWSMLKHAYKDVVLQTLHLDWICVASDSKITETYKRTKVWIF